MPKARDFLAKATRGSVRGRVSPVVGPTWARFSSVLFTLFLFPFLPKLIQF
jgi:hypothetical protein